MTSSLMSGILWSSTTLLPMDLSLAPRLHALGFGLHGDVPFESYKLRGLWCLHLYRYTGEAVIAGEVLPIRPGFASITPPDTDLKHLWVHPGSRHISAHFALDGTDSAPVSMPAMQDLGVKWEEVYTKMTFAAESYLLQPGRAESALWSTLWLLADAGQASISPPALHPAVRQTLQSVEARLAAPLAVAELANECELSHNHLTRLFKAQMGQTVVAYIRKRRMERAHYLLTFSSLPIKAIAIQVGIADLRQFNKAVRQAAGASPRQVREQRLGASDRSSFAV